MNSKLVASLFAAMLVGASCAAAVVLSGGGLLLGFVAYSFAGSFALVPIAMLACQEAPVPAEHSTPAPACA